MTPTPPNKDEQTPLSEESLRDKVQKLVFNDKYELTDVQSIKLRDSLVKLIIAERQAWGEYVIGEDAVGCERHPEPSDLCSSGACLAAGHTNDVIAEQRQRNRKGGE